MAKRLYPAQRMAAQVAFRILSISYDAALLFTRHELLQSRGYSVVSVEGFTAALEKCREDNFGLAIMGHSIPHQDKQALRDAISQGCAAPIIALLRTGEPPLEGAAAQVNPLSPLEFLNAVEKVLSRLGDSESLKSETQSVWTNH